MQDLHRMCVGERDRRRMPRCKTYIECVRERERQRDREIERNEGVEHGEAEREGASFVF